MHASLKQGHPPVKLTIRRLRSSVTPEQEKPSQTAERGFQEPPLATPRNGTTGQPLEEPPNNASKRELGTLKKVRRLSEGEEEHRKKQRVVLRLKEEKYVDELDTQTSENLTRSSRIRTKGATAASRKASGDNVEEVSDADYRDYKHNKSSRLQKSPVKTSRSAKGNVNFSQASKREVENADRSDDDDDIEVVEIMSDSKTESSSSEAASNQDFCTACGLAGSFICCEGCPRSFHFHCLNPPLDPNDLPDRWFCPDCLGRRDPQSGRAHNVGILGRMLDELPYMNPSAFRLPREICECFEGVAMDKVGDFLDDSQKPARTYRQIVKDLEDPLHGVYDKEGKPNFCHNCGGSGLNHRELMKCDFCPLWWHLDCLDPPMAAVKQMGKKWMCPNHTETVVKPALKLRGQPVMEVSATTGVKLPPNAHIEIENVEDRYAFDEQDVATLTEQNPSYKFRLTDNGKQLKYTVAPKMAKYMDHVALGNVTYRLKEEGVILDFIHGAKLRKKAEVRHQDHQNLLVYGSVQRELKDYLSSLSALSRRSLVSESRKKINFDQLLEIADVDYKVENTVLDKEELRELLIIKKLMEMKGPDKMLKFLKEG